MSLKLYVFPPSPRAFKVLFAAHQFALDYEFCLVDLTKGGQRTPAFLALNRVGGRWGNKLSVKARRRVGGLQEETATR